jgi:hypothetical protein
MSALRELLRIQADPYAGVSAVEVLDHTPIDRLDETVAALKQHRSMAEVRRAMVERIARAPLADFHTVKYVYLKHCGDSR